MKYLGCIPSVKNFKLGRLKDKHPIFAVIQKEFGLFRNQVKLYCRIRSNKEYDAIYIFKRAG